MPLCDLLVSLQAASIIFCRAKAALAKRGAVVHAQATRRLLDIFRSCVAPSLIAGMHGTLAVALASLHCTAALTWSTPPRRRCTATLRATEEEIAWMLAADDDDAWDDDEDDEAFDEQMRVRATAEHESYASRATPLAPATDAVDAVRTRGVALVENCLPDASLREALRSRILERRDAGAGLSSVLGERCDDGATTRFDIRLPYDDVVSKATSSLLRRDGPLAAALDALVGPKAQLWECAALVSEAGAPAQTVHGDTF